jgi:hypothetical protein
LEPNRYQLQITILNHSRGPLSVQLSRVMFLSGSNLACSLGVWLNFKDRTLERHYQEFAGKQLRRRFDTMRVIISLAYFCSTAYIARSFHRCPQAAVAPVGCLVIDISLLLLKEQDYTQARVPFLTGMRLGTLHKALANASAKP